MSETLKEASQNVKRYLSNEWVKWVHGGSKPAYTSEEKDANTVAGGCRQTLRYLLEFERLLFYNR